MRGPLPEIDTVNYGGRRPGWRQRLAWRLATAHWPGGWRRRIRKRVARRFAGPFDVSAGDLKMRVYPAENHCDRTVIGRGHLPEAPERDLIGPLLKDGMVFVDVGANVGVYSLHVSDRTRGTARVVALEPHPRTFRKLDFNCAINGFDRVSRINAGAGGDDGETTLFFDGGGNVGNASLLQSVGGRPAETVRIRPLVAILSEEGIERVDLLKIDVEGFEDRALMPFLRSAEPALWPRHVLLETVHAHLWSVDLVAALRDRGYREVGQTSENSLFARDVGPAAVQSAADALDSA